MAKKRLYLDKQVHFPPFKYGDRCYDLSHLDAHKVEFIHNNDPKRDPIRYTFNIIYSFHYFAKDFPSLDETQRHTLMYHTERITTFLFSRYHLKKVRNLNVEELALFYIKKLILPSLFS